MNEVRAAGFQGPSRIFFLPGFFRNLISHINPGKDQRRAAGPALNAVAGYSGAAAKEIPFQK